VLLFLGLEFIGDGGACAAGSEADQARIFDGLTQLPGKIVSVFEPHTEIIRKGNASKPTEFGKLMRSQEAENQIMAHYEVFDERPSDRELLPAAVETHERKQMEKSAGSRKRNAGARAAKNASASSSGGTDAADVVIVARGHETVGRCARR